MSYSVINNSFDQYWVTVSAGGLGSGGNMSGRVLHVGWSQTHGARPGAREDNCLQEVDTVVVENIILVDIDTKLQIHSTFLYTYFPFLDFQVEVRAI